jgi:hypothetical protein
MGYTLQTAILGGFGRMLKNGISQVRSCDVRFSLRFGGRAIVLALTIMPISFLP